MRFLCRIGYHKFNKREIHIEEDVSDGKKTFLACVIERCQCNVTRFGVGGGKKPTSIHVPNKYWRGVEQRKD